MEGRRVEFEKLCAIIAEVMGIDAGEIAEDTAFVEDLGADSLDMFQIVLEVEEKFDIGLDIGSADQIISVGAAAEAIKKAVG